MKRIINQPVKGVLLVLCVILLTPGCMRAIEQATGLELSKNMNPVMELEMDLVFLDEIAAYTKLNEMILERVPISMDDPWPELLNHYTQDLEGGEERAKEYYDACLNDLLRNDFFFYRTYDTTLYFNLLGTGGAKALLARAVISARDLLVIEGAKALGRRYEHAKWIVSYYPLGCKCPYFSSRFGSLNPGSTECLRVKPLIQCPFFVDPTEMMLYEYLFGEGGFDSWVALQIRPECFRVVEGERLGTFEEVYYTLLPDHLQERIRRMDDDVNMTGSDLEATKALLEDDGLPSREVNRLEKEKKRLDALLDKKLSAQKKLYEQAESMLEATPEKVKKARTLLLVVDFIENGFADISTAMTALSIKLADDLLGLSEFGTEQITSSMTYLVTQGVASGSFAAKRAELLGKRLFSIPVNYAQVWGYAAAQKYRVSKYRAYLEALVSMGAKLNR